MNKLQNKVVGTRIARLSKQSKISKYIQLQNLSNKTVSVFFDNETGFFRLAPGAVWSANFKQSPGILAQTESGKTLVSIMEIQNG